MSSAGFGIGSGGSGYDPEAAQRAPLPGGAPEEVTAKDIHAIRARYDQPQFFDPQIITSLASGATVVIDRSQAKMNALLVCCTVGAFNVWFGNYSGNQQPASPHAQVTAGTTQQFMLPLGPYVFTIQASGAASTGCVTPMAI